MLKISANISAKTEEEEDSEEGSPSASPNADWKNPGRRESQSAIPDYQNAARASIGQQNLMMS